MNLPTYTETIPTRSEQLASLHGIALDSQPLLLHGSLAHAAVMGEPLPTAEKPEGLRDIDVVRIGERSGKYAVEETLQELGLAHPNPIDAGLCDLLRFEQGGAVATLGGVKAILQDKNGILTETRDYEVKGGDGLIIRSFSPVGLFAIHSIMPKRAIHPGDSHFEKWCHDRQLDLPEDLSRSIRELHRANNSRAQVVKQKLLIRAADLYSKAVPERVRAQFRDQTHRYMKKHTGRPNPFE